VVGLAILLLAAIGLGYWFFANRSANATQIESIAVLPFENQNLETEYLSDGLTESVINNLTRLPNLRVISRNSVFRYKGKETDSATVGRELDVRSVLTGRVVQRGDSLIISAELTDLRDNKQIWGQQYNRKVTDAFALQQEISRDISETLRSKLTGEQQQRLTKRETVSPEAYQLYLKGRYYWNKREDKEFIKALEYFQQAIDKDPTYALAYVGLAESYLIGGSNNLSRWEKVSKAKATAQKALEIDATLGEAHTTLANIKHWDDWNWEEAEKEYKLAIELSPNYATAHHWYAESLSAVGRFDESFAEYNRALEIDPLSLAISTDLGLAYYLSRQYDRAIEHLKKLRETDPNYVRTHFYLARVYEQKGMFEEAISEYEKGFILEGDNPNDVAKDIASLRSSFKVGGAKGYWQKILDRTIKGQERGDFDGKFLFLRVKQLPLDIARLYAHLGERYEAFRWLEKAYHERNGELAELKVAPEWDNLRSDPRFQDLVRRIGLPQ
jgi:TolB-like protein/Flp pilus assembly protein TadD